MSRKSDSEIEQWVLRELSFRLKLQSREVCISAHDGVVRVMGSAPNNDDKLAIEESVRRANGVVGVVNKIMVKPSTTDRRTSHTFRRKNLSRSRASNSQPSA
jgi:osmotically-inducible protein OsmY